MDLGDSVNSGSQSQTDIEGILTKETPSEVRQAGPSSWARDSSADNIFEKGLDIQRLSEQFLKKLGREERRLREEYVILEKKYERDSCTFCNRGNEAVKHCVDCDQFLCSSCIDNHTFKTNSEHQVVSVADNSVSANSGVNGESVVHCSKHEGKEMSIFCVTCDELLCSDCAELSHSGHEFQKFPDLVQGLRERLQSGLGKFTVYRDKSEEACQELTNKAQALVDEKLESMRVLKERLFKILTTILKEECAIRTELLTKTMSKVNEVHAKRTLVRTLDSQVDQYLELVSEYLKKDNFQLFKDRKCLLDQLDSLEKTTAGFLDQNSFREFVELGWSFQMANSSSSEAASGLSTTSFIYTNNGSTNQDVPVPSSESLDGLLRAFEQNLAKNSNALTKPRKCPATQLVSKVDETEGLIPSKQNGHQHLDDSEPEHIPDEHEGKRVRKFKYSKRNYDEDDESSRDSDYDPILLTALNETRARNTRRTSNETLNSTAGQAYYDSDSDYSGVSDKIKEWTKAAANKSKARADNPNPTEEDKPDNSAAVKQEGNSETPVATEEGEVEGAEKSKATPSPRRRYEISENYQSRAKRDSRGRVPKNLEGFKIDLPRSNQVQPKVETPSPSPAKSDAEPRNKRRARANEEPEVKDAPSSKKLKSEPSVTKGRKRGAPSKDSDDVEDKSDVEEVETKPEPKRRGRKPKPKPAETESPKPEEPVTPQADVTATPSQPRGRPRNKPGPKPKVKENQIEATDSTITEPDESVTETKPRNKPGPKPKVKENQTEATDSAVPEPDEPVAPQKPRNKPGPKPKIKENQTEATDLAVPEPDEPVAPQKPRNKPGPKPKVKENQIEAMDSSVPEPDEPVTEKKPRNKPGPKPKIQENQIEATDSAIPEPSEPVEPKTTRKRQTLNKESPLQPKPKAKRGQMETVAVDSSNPEIPVAVAAGSDAGAPAPTAKARTKLRIDKSNGVTNELDYQLTPTSPDKDKMKITFDDTNEDYCTVCLDGGGVLICCDVCPKVFHEDCHLPAIKGVPEDDWQCLFCTKKEDLGTIKNEEGCARGKQVVFPKVKNIPDPQFIYLCKFLSELFNCKESLVVRGLFERILQMNNEEEPVHLNYIRSRVTLQIPEPFGNIEEIIAVIRKMFGQAKEYYSADTECGKRARTFEHSFNELLVSYYPDKA